MLKKTLVLSIILTSNFLFAQTLEQVLSLVEVNNYDIKKQRFQILAAEANIELSNTWQNPILGIGVNDINFDRPTSRDLEAMQTQYITYSQVIPTNGKLKSKSEISKYDVTINTLRLKNNIDKLKSLAMGYSYTIYLQQEKLKIVKNYLDNLLKQKELMSLLYENGKIDQSKLVSIDLRIYKLKLKQQKLNYKVSQTKLSLENIIYEKLNKLELDTKMDFPKIELKNVLSNHFLVLIENEKIKQQKEKTELAEKEKFSDIKLTVGYYDRERFDDYASFNISIPLSIQGSEKLKIKKSKIDRDSLENGLLSLKQQIKTTVRDLEEKLQISKENYSLIQNTMIPLNDTLKQSHTIHLSTNMMNSLSVYESKNSKYDLLLLGKDEQISYFNALSKLVYFKGNL